MSSPVAPVGPVAPVSPAGVAGPVPPAPTLPDAESFSAAFARAADAAASATPGAELGKLLDPLLDLNGHSAKLAEAANLQEAESLRPGELLVLTMRSHEFLFHCELVSNVANRSSDGVQQLFRQQS